MTSKPKTVKGGASVKTENQDSHPVAVEEDVVIASASPDPAAGVVRKPKFIERVVERAEMRKRDVKPAAEATLAVLAEAIAAGEELVLPPLGKIRVSREKDVNNGTVYVVKIRIPNATDPHDEENVEEAIAEPAE